MAAAERGGAEFRILGPLLVLVDGEELPVPGEKLQALLGRLLLAPGHPVSAERLIDDLWGEEAACDRATEPPRPRDAAAPAARRGSRRRLDARERSPRLRPAGRRRPHRRGAFPAAARRCAVGATAPDTRPLPASSTRRRLRSGVAPCWRACDSTAPTATEPNSKACGSLHSRNGSTSTSSSAPAASSISELEQLVRKEPYRERLLGAVDAGALCVRPAGRLARRLPGRAGGAGGGGARAGGEAPRARDADPQPGSEAGDRAVAGCESTTAPGRAATGRRAARLRRGGDRRGRSSWPCETIRPARPAPPRRRCFRTVSSSSTRRRTASSPSPGSARGRTASRRRRTRSGSRTAVTAPSRSSISPRDRCGSSAASRSRTSWPAA